MEMAVLMRKSWLLLFEKLVRVLSYSTVPVHGLIQFSGITLSAATLSNFMTSLTASPHSHAISFREFRDFLLLLPRKVSTAEIYRFYEVRRSLGDDGRGPARVTMEGSFPLIEDHRLLELFVMHYRRCKLERRRQTARS